MSDNGDPEIDSAPSEAGSEQDALVGTAGLDKPIRTFMCDIRNIRIRNAKDLVRPVVQFTLGGNFKVEDLRHKKQGIVTSGKKGKVFRTEKLRPGDADMRTGATFKKRFVKYWKGEYHQLKKQDLTIEVFDFRKCCNMKSVGVGSATLNLEKWANGSIQQELEIQLHEAGKHQITCDLAFVGYFQEVWTYPLHFVDWRGTNLRAADSSGTSDPYIEFIVKRDWSKLFQKGGAFGRTCKSDKIMNTLYPEWADAGTLLFHGIRSQVENQVLDIQVYDWDRVGSNELIGEARVPLRGIIDYGSLGSGLEYATRTKVEGKWQFGTEPAGSVEGSVLCEELPPHTQIGDVMTLLPGFQYLAVKLVEASSMPSMDANGLSDVFFSVDWDVMSQNTRVVYRDLNPVFNEVVYFPVRILGKNAEALAKIGNIKCSAYDWDEAGHDRIGGFEITMHDITAAALGEYEKGSPKSRLFSNGSAKLVDASGEEIENCSVSVEAWFQPDMPEDLVVSADQSITIRTLPEEYYQRQKKWRKMVPKKCKKDAAYEIEATDESGQKHFLPTYLTALQSPKELQGNALLIARTVQCFTFTSDVEAFAGLDDVWTTPNGFLDMKKGDSEEHAVLQVNLLLGCGYDAYICNGKARNGEDHTWVMTLEPDGSVIFWETTNGKKYVLAERWQGVDDMGALEEESEEEEAFKPVEKLKGKKGKKDVVEMVDIKAGFDESEMMMFDDSDVVLDVREVMASNEAITEAPGGGALEDFVGATPDDDDSDDGEEYEYVDTPYLSIETVFNHENLWANIQRPDPTQISYQLDNEMEWLPFISFRDGFAPGGQAGIESFYTARRLGPRLQPVRAKEMRDSIWDEVRNGIRNWRHGKNMETTFVDEMIPVLDEGLGILEGEKRTGEKEELSIAKWKGDISAVCPGGHEFRGKPICFYFSDPRRVRKVLMEHFPWHEDTNPDVKFAVGCHVEPYYNAVQAVWVYLAHMIPKDQ